MIPSSKSFGATTRALLAITLFTFLHSYGGAESPMDDEAESSSYEEAAASTTIVCEDNPLYPVISSRSSSTTTAAAEERFDYNLWIPSLSDPCNGIVLYWNVNNETLHIAVAAPVTGWVGIGFTETGGMRGADIVYYEASSNELVDAHVPDAYVRPIADVLQDWTLIDGQVLDDDDDDDDVIFFEAERSLFTNKGHEDIEIINDASVFVHNHLMIAAWGDGSSIGFHGANVARKSVQLFPDEDNLAGDGQAIFDAEMTSRAEGSVQLTLDGYTIPTRETTYSDVCYTVNDLIALGLYKDASSSPYLIGFGFLVDPEVVEYLHHIVLYAHSNSCGSVWERKVVAAWTPGNDFVYFPEGMGLPVGQTKGGSGFGASFEAFTIEYHFDNPGGRAGQIDNGSGVELYYTNDALETEIGMTVMGDLAVSLGGELIGEGKTQHTYECPSGCTNDALASTDSVTVIFEAHHMHQTGKRLTNELIRDDTVINTATIDYWDFYQNGAAIVRQEPYVVQKGDAYRTTCYFHDEKGDVRYGAGSSDEMCMTFLYYYPRQVGWNNCSPANSFFASCRSEFSSVSLSSDSNFDRDVTDTTMTPAPVSAEPLIPGESSPTTSADESSAFSSTTSQMIVVVSMCLLSFAVL
mmetsp:Transcript_24488/g.37251  ORF Transcript_24488/g.37251 Transcript_24488/m.37251 type:complete len:636 (+) Transcript_24488:115-2022(+)|eukprot:CAMPEP_0178914016 /NCGR_PEP_ID=MMETSP0786-20121207/11174_1 /TAXON_ID=186022 /ORGANISM="Thalassionema frauenfeldii, Strain CCMP 1798" /LENGTH=635 /DNA_ID=CAMNT_0020586843 /DNA_START=43 /DNA_END=1950 /DNA_ORIENTATION=+